MKKIDIKDMPAFPQASKRPVSFVGIQDLKEVGMGMVSFGMRPGDVIEFPSTPDDVIIAKQPIRAEAESAQQFMINVLRNEKPDWLSVGTLNRRDKSGAASCEAATNLNLLANAQERVNSLIGKKIIVDKETVGMEVTVFENAVPTDKTKIQQFVKFTIA